MWTISDRRPFVSLILALVVLTWLVLWIWGQSPYGRFLSHEGLGEVDTFLNSEHIFFILVFILGWTLMTVAMMLPTSLSLITLFHSITRRRSDQVLLVALLIFGYLTVWVIFGFLAHICDWGLHKTVEHNAWLGANTWVLGTVPIILAGIYQFTPLKYYCLERCRSPLSFIMEHWRGGNGRIEAFRLGVHHGIFCVGCCWALMFLMFAVGAGNIGWMLALGTVMAVEKNVSWGRRFSTPLGIALLCWGLILVALGLR